MLHNKDSVKYTNRNKDAAVESQDSRSSVFPNVIVNISPEAMKRNMGSRQQNAKNAR